MAHYFEREEFRTLDFDLINEYEVEIYLSKRGRLPLDLLDFFADIPWEYTTVRYYGDDSQIQIKFPKGYGFIVKYLAEIVDYDPKLSRILKGKQVRAYVDDLSLTPHRVYVVID